ncbi:hypothetical protein AAL_05970 [Moelleriella libera RCEF 2490]|uniref:Rhodopsin domain-containing protein n=1 Tax=Moelleriella libera RCEF 2490 TaxID=1081109 RepID=A0A167ZPH0_9HYPO|nr:hypothetical protein AAL_05970 [Moelleriella libera RCEF 2490]
MGAHDEDHRPITLSASSLTTILAATAFSLRICVRFNRRVLFGIDDGWLIASLLLLIGHFAIILVEVKLGGLGVPLLVNLEQDPAFLNRLLKIVFVQTMLSPISITVIKCSVLALYWRLFPTRFIRWSCIAISCILFVWCLSIVITCFMECSPIQEIWNLQRTDASCNPMIHEYLAWQDSIPEMVTTIIIFVLPIYEVMRMHATLRNRVAVSAIFLTGSLTIVSSIVRFVKVCKYHFADVAGSESDPTLDMADMLLWVHIEVCTGFIAACLPALRPVSLFIAQWVGLAKKSRTGRPPDEEIIAIGRSAPRLSQPMFSQNDSVLFRSSELLRYPFWLQESQFERQDGNATSSGEMQGDNLSRLHGTERV